MKVCEHFCSICNPIRVIESWSCITWKQALRSTLSKPNKLAYWASPHCLHLAHIPPISSHLYFIPNYHLKVMVVSTSKASFGSSFQCRLPAVKKVVPQVPLKSLPSLKPMPSCFESQEKEHSPYPCPLVILYTSISLMHSLLN